MFLPFLGNTVMKEEMKGGKLNSLLMQLFNDEWSHISEQRDGKFYIPPLRKGEQYFLLVNYNNYLFCLFCRSGTVVPEYEFYIKHFITSSIF